MKPVSNVSRGIVAELLSFGEGISVGSAISHNKDYSL